MKIPRTNAHRSTSHSDRIPAVDGLRALSVLLVVFSHELLTRPEYPTVPFKEYLALIFHGTLGVQFFFVLSGFVITRSLLADQERLGRVSYLQFYHRRVFRLFPALFVSIGLLSMLSWFVNGQPVQAACLVSSLTMTEGIFRKCGWDLAHLWSLTVEELFYVGWPAIFVVFLRYPKLVVALFIASSVALRTWVHVNPAHPAVAVIGLLQYFDHFLLGGGLVLAWKHHGFRMALRMTEYSRAILFAGLALFYIPVILSHHGWFAWLTVPFGKFCSACGATVLLAHAILLPDSKWARALSIRPLVTVGLMSYSIYLLQQPFYTGTAVGKNLGFLFFPVNLTVIFLLAALTYRFIEKPFLALGRNLAKRWWSQPQSYSAREVA